MNVNTLLHKPGLGQVKKTQFNSPQAGQSFGLASCKNQEGAKDVILSWKAHEPTSSDGHSQPGADFKAMNKLATMSGITQAGQLPGFRSHHFVTVKHGKGLEMMAQRHSVRLPSQRNPQHTYGSPPGHRTAEDVRNYGPSEPKVAQLVKGAFQYEWVDMNTARRAEFDEKAHWIAPAHTHAAMGHSMHAADRFGAKQRATIRDLHDNWKMRKFTRVEAKVTQYMGRAAHDPPKA